MENKTNVFKKIITCICLGLLFGVFAGLGFIVVQKTTSLNISSGLLGENVVSEIAENKKTDETTTETTEESSTINTGYSLGDTQQVTVITETSDVTKVAETAMPAMVSISKEYNYEDAYSYYFGGGNSVATASGSGIIIAETDTEYLIVSNNHVVEDPVSLEVTFVDGETASAYIKGCDSDVDIAVIAVQKDDVKKSTMNEIRIAAIGDSTTVKLGEQVVAIGNALGYGQSVTTGIISAIDREIEAEDGSTNKLLQTDAAINPGNSGGALLNMAGQVIGINSSKIGGSTVEGMGYAIPISTVTDIISELMEHQTRIPIDEDQMGYIGINLQEVTESLSKRFNMPVGIYIVETTEGGAAQAAGLKTGDIITKFAGDKIRSYDDLQNVLKYYPAGSTVSITFQRQENGEYTEHQVDITLGSKPASSK